MTSPDSGALRLARASAFALCAFGLSVTAHVVGGGRVPSAVATAVLLASCVWVSVFLTWRRLGIGTSVLALGGLQVLLHQALMVASAGGTCMGMVHAHAHQLGGAPITAMCAAPAHEAGQGGAIGWGMTLAHAASAAILGVLLARADQAVCFLATLRFWSLPSRLSVVTVSGRVRVAPPAPARIAILSVLTQVRRRGPPRAAAPALA